MRGTLFGLALAATMALPQGAESQALKVGYIDSGAILAEYEGAQRAREEMQSSLNSYQAEVQQMGEELQQAIAEFQQQQLTMTAEARANREEELATRQRSYQERISELESQAERRQAEVFQPVMSEINEVIEQIRVEGSYALILDVASQAILAADPALDLTQEVLRRLQVGADGVDGGAGS